MSKAIECAKRAVRERTVADEEKRSAAVLNIMGLKDLSDEDKCRLQESWKSLRQLKGASSESLMGNKFGIPCLYVRVIGSYATRMLYSLEELPLARGQEQG